MANLHLELAKVILSEADKITDDSKKTFYHQQSIHQALKAFGHHMSESEEQSVFEFLKENLKKCPQSFQIEIQESILNPKKKGEGNQQSNEKSQDKGTTKKGPTEEEEIIKNFVEGCKVKPDEINEIPWEMVILQPHIINQLRENIELGLHLYNVGFLDSFVGHLIYGKEA